MRFFYLFCLLIIGEMAVTQNLTVMTYNIRYDNPGDGPNRWDNRKEILTDQILFYKPMVFGIQEGMLHQVEYMDSVLRDYAYVGVGRDDGKKMGEFSALFYKTDALDTLQTGTFWLSNQPTLPSKGWDAALPRVCTYAQFAYQNNEFWVFNTHFDHIGKQARAESARLILRQIKRLTKASDPVILIGDFNARGDDEPIRVITESLKDSRQSALHFYGPEVTFNAFSMEYDPTNRIDYIFHSDNIVTERVAILSQVIDGRFPSDHFPVLAEVRLEN